VASFGRLGGAGKQAERRRLVMILQLGIGVFAVGMVWAILRAFAMRKGWGVACLLFPPAFLGFAVAHWRQAGRPLAVVLVGSGLWLIGSVVRETRGKGLDLEGDWLAKNGSMVIAVEKSGAIVSKADGARGTWKRQGRDSFLLQDFPPYVGGNYNPQRDELSLSRTGVGSRGPWVIRLPFTRITDENKARADAAMAKLGSGKRVVSGER